MLFFKLFPSLRLECLERHSSMEYKHLPENLARAKECREGGGECLVLEEEQLSKRWSGTLYYWLRLSLGFLT